MAFLLSATAFSSLAHVLEHVTNALASGLSSREEGSVTTVLPSPWGEHLGMQVPML